MIYTIFLSIHIISSIVWIGAVYMGAFIDWPVAKKSMPKGLFPFNFIIGQGIRVFYSVYTGIILLWISGIALILMKDFSLKKDIYIITIKFMCLLFMTSFTLYGTFFTWPKLQFSNNKEAFIKYKLYIYRAIGTFTLGIISAFLGVWLRK